MRKNIISSLTLGLTVASLATILVTNGNQKKIALSNDCDHTGNHYTELANSIFFAGTKEYWVCCKCHNHFFEKPEGSWTENGQAPKVTNSDDRYIDSIFKTHGVSKGEVIENGYTFDGMLDPTKQYVCYNKPLSLTNLSFTFKCDNLTTNYEECVGFYLHTHGSVVPISKAFQPIVFSLWSGVGYGNEIFGYLSNNESYETESIALGDLEATKNGFNTSGGPVDYYRINDLIDITFNFSVMDNGFLKIEMKSNNINCFSGHNAYNVNGAGDTVFTYVSPSSLGKKDLANTEFYLSLFGKRFTHIENSSTITITNISQ